MSNLIALFKFLVSAKAYELDTLPEKKYRPVSLTLACAVIGTIDSVLNIVLLPFGKSIFMQAYVSEFIMRRALDIQD